MSHESDLREQLALLQQQVIGLRRSVQVLRGLWILLAAAGVLGLGLGGRQAWAVAQKREANEVTCSALKIVDDQGRVQVQLGYDKFGGVVTVKNTAGKTVAALEVDADGGFLSIIGHDGIERTFVGVGEKESGGLIYLKDDKGKNRATFTVYKDGHGGLTFRNDQGKNEIFLGPSTKNWGGILNLNAPDGKARLIMDVDKDGRGAVELLNNDQKSEVFIGTSAKGWGGLMNLNAPSGTAGVIFDIDDKGNGRVNLRTREGKRFLFAGGDHEGGTVSLYGLDGKERLFVGVGDKQTGGIMYLLNPDNNKARLLLGVDNSGVGFVEGRDDAGVTKRSLQGAR